MFSHLKKFDFRLLLPFVCALFILVFISKVHPNSILVSDNQRKIIQAQALVDSNFQSESSSCPLLQDLDRCSYFHRGSGNAPIRKVGIFPIAFSIVASIFGWFGDYSPLYYMALGLYLLGLLILKFRSQIHWAGILVLTFGPCFFHSMLFPDYSITFSLTALLVSFYARPSPRTWVNVLVGLLAGLTIFFRPENIFLTFFLGIFQLIDFIRNRNTSEDSIDKNRLILLIASGVTVLAFALINYSLYGSVFGTRIAGNAKGLFTQEQNKALSLLLFGNGRIGFLTFSPWIILGFLLLALKFRFLEKKEKFLLGSAIASLIAVVLFAPNDSNIDWGTRYLSWISVPAVLLFFAGNSNSILLSFGRKIRITAIALSSLSLLISLLYLFVQIQYSNGFLKYNSWFKKQKTEVTVLQQPNIETLFGQDIIRRKVLFPNRKKDPKEFVEFLTARKSKVDLIRFDAATIALAEKTGPPQGESDYVPGADARLEKEFIRQGWKPIAKQVLDKIEIITLIH